MPLTKRKEPLTEEEQTKFDLQQEEDIGRHRRLYKILSRDSERHYRLAHIKLPKYYTTMQKIHLNILENLNVALLKKKADAKITENVSSLLEAHDSYQYKVRRERQYNEAIDQQIRAVKKDTHELKVQNAEEIRKEDNFSYYISKVNEAQENKLEVQVKKFGAVYSELVVLRDSINKMLHERELFMKLWNKLTGRLDFGKKVMMDLITQTSIAYEQREEWCNKLKELRVKAYSDLAADHDKILALKRKEENHSKFETFVTLKGHRRSMTEIKTKEERKRAESRKKLADQKQKYATLLNEIQDFTQGTPVETVAKNFCNQDASNFSSLNCVTELIEEMEMINDKLGNIRMELKERKAAETFETQTQKGTLKSQEKQLAAVQYTYRNSEEEVKAHETYFKQVLNGITELFRVCRCDSDSLLNLLDAKAVTVHNVMFYLQLIETNILSALLSIYHRDKLLFDSRKINYSKRYVREPTTKPVIYPIEMVTKNTPCPLCYFKYFDTAGKNPVVWDRLQVKSKVSDFLQTGDPASRVHNVSACQLPTSRRMMQKRFS